MRTGRARCIINMLLSSVRRVILCELQPVFRAVGCAVLVLYRLCSILRTDAFCPLFPWLRICQRSSDEHKHLACRHPRSLTCRAIRTCAYLALKGRVASSTTVPTTTSGPKSTVRLHTTVLYSTVLRTVGACKFQGAA
jgi:hypothetical protein